MSKKKILAIIVVFLILSFIAIDMFIVSFPIKAEDIIEMVKSEKKMVFFLLMSMYIFKSFIWFIPLNLLYMIAGITYGTELGLLITYAGLMINMSIGYLVGSLYGKKHIRNKIEKYKKGEWLFSLVDRNIYLSCVLGRIFPGPPVDLVSMFFGMSVIKYLPYIFISLLSISVKMLPYFLAGSKISNPLSLEFILPFSVGIILTVITSIIAIYKRKKINKPSNH